MYLSFTELTTIFRDLDDCSPQVDCSPADALTLAHEGTGGRKYS